MPSQSLIQELETPLYILLDSLTKENKQLFNICCYHARSVWQKKRLALMLTPGGDVAPLATLAPGNCKKNRLMHQQFLERVSQVHGVTIYKQESNYARHASFRINIPYEAEEQFRHVVIHPNKLDQLDNNFTKLTPYRIQQILLSLASDEN